MKRTAEQVVERLRNLPVRNDGNGIGFGYVAVPLGLRDEVLAALEYREARRELRERAEEEGQMTDEENDFYDGEDEDMEGDGEFDFDCGAMYGPKGEPMGCSMAGSEDCDWECPYRAEVERSLAAQYAANVRWAKVKRERESGDGA